MLHGVETKKIRREREREKKRVDEGYINRTLLYNGNPLHVAAFLSIFTIEAEI